MVNEKNVNASDNLIVINIADQELSFYDFKSDYKQPQKVFKVSTAKNGTGSQENTGCTPLGKHYIANKIGDNMPVNTVFVGRVATGEIYNESLATSNPKRDWILTRILWLQGREEGINKGYNEKGCCDTHQRYIYIHGTPDTEPMGIPMSHGCIRMRNKEIIWLFDQVDEGTPVEILEK